MKNREFSSALNKAKEGDQESQLLVAKELHRRGGRREDMDAFYWFKLIASEGVPEAQSYLGSMHEFGRGTHQNPLEAVRLYRLASRNNEPLAQALLGYMHLVGDTVEADEREALSLIKKSADRGNEYGLGILGMFYIREIPGIRLSERSAAINKEDIEKAQKLFIEAIDGHYGIGDIGLGIMYCYGYLESQEIDPYELAKKHFFRAGMKGHPSACWNLETHLNIQSKYDCYDIAKVYAEMARRDFCEKKAMENTETALHWLDQSANLGYCKAKVLIGDIYYNTNSSVLDMEKAAELYRQAAILGNTEAEYKYGKMCLEGTGIKLNENEGKKWLLAAADKGNADAQFSVGELMIKGRVFRQDRTEGERYLQMAAEQGNEDAEFYFMRVD